MSNVIYGVFGPAPEPEPTDDELRDDHPFAPPSPASSLTWLQVCSASRFRLWSTRTKYQRAQKDDLLTQCFNTVMSVEMAAGTLFVRAQPSNEPLMIEGITRRMYRIGERCDELLSYLWVRYRLNGKDPLTHGIISNLKSLCHQRGWMRDIRRYVVYDADRSALYLSRYDGSVWSLTGNGVDVEKNGERVFFADDDGGRIWTGRSPLIAPNGKLLDVIGGLNYAQETPGGMSPDDQRRALIVWMFACAFPDLQPTKPLLLLEGAEGSGKSTAVYVLQQIVHGRVRGMQVSKKREDDFGIQLLRSPIAMFDNLDTFVEWIPDAVCFYATHGEWVRRRLYTDDAESVLKPHSFVAFTSRSPSSFRRGDVADRLVILRLDRRKPTDFVPQAALTARIEHDIDDLYGEWLYWCNRIVRRLQSGLPQTGGYRMADFAAMAAVVAEVLGWSDAELVSMLDSMQRERDAFAGETDPTLDLLERWVGNPMNEGREVEAATLMTALNLIAEATSAPTIRSVSTLVQRLRSPYLQARFDVAVAARTSLGVPKWTYAIRRKG